MCFDSSMDDPVTLVLSSPMPCSDVKVRLLIARQAGILRFALLIVSSRLFWSD